MVVADSSEISFKIDVRDFNFLVSLDSRFQTVDHNIELSVTKGDFKARLLKLENNNIFDTLRHKLNWGLDARN